VEALMARLEALAEEQERGEGFVGGGLRVEEGERGGKKSWHA